MGAEKGSSDRCWPFAAHASGGEQRFALVRQIEAVAGFDLDRRHAFADQRVETRQTLADEFVLARRAQGLDRGDDAAAGARDLFIARAAQPHLEFAGAISRVDEMRMAIDQAGGDPATVASDRLFGVSQRRRQVRFRAGEDDASLADRNRAAVDGADADPMRRERRQARAGPEPIT